MTFNVNVNFALNHETKRFFMSLFDELMTAIADVKSTVTAESQEIGDRIAGLNAKVAELEDRIANGSLTEDQKVQVFAEVASLKEAIKLLETPDAPPEA
jgi:hypothetical protein